nr:formin-like protein 5 [Aegilops tauschii subsp. strangulata]
MPARRWPCRSAPLHAPSRAHSRSAPVPLPPPFGSRSRPRIPPPLLATAPRLAVPGRARARSPQPPPLLPALKPPLLAAARVRPRRRFCRWPPRIPPASAHPACTHLRLREPCHPDACSPPRHGRPRPPPTASGLGNRRTPPLLRLPLRPHRAACMPPPPPLAGVVGAGGRADGLAELAPGFPQSGTREPLRS